MKKIKPLTEGRVKSQIKTYTGEEPKTQAPPPPKPPKRCGGYPRDWVKLKPTEKQLERERKRLFSDEQWDEIEGGILPDFQHIPPPPEKIKSNNMEKRLGKIKNVRFGIGGYQDCQLGIHFDLGTDTWGVTDSKSVWDPEKIKCSENSQWTEEDRNKAMNDVMRYTSSLLKDAKVNFVVELKGKPVEITMEGNMLKEWRILTEVL